MDNSSRNIVKFIGAITFAALLIMAARYYADSQNVEAPAEVAEVAEEVVAKDPEPVESEEAQADDAETNTDDTENPDGEIIEEDAQLIMGEPSLNLEQGGSSDYAPPAAEEPPVEE
jgi:hypothetical protein